MYLPRSKNLKTNSQSLRKSATKEEKHLWYDYLKNCPLQFYRQRVIGHYIVDFYCPSVKLAVEIDGSQHYDDDAKQHDKERTDYLNNIGVEVIRFTNDDIHNNFESVCIIVTNKAKERCV